MILNTSLSHDAQYIGNVQEHRVGIDKNNIDFITTLLTSNLYSKPLESFLRETISNAYDSHIEAGTNEHILLLIEDTDSYKNYRISIRDYGVGVSPERFEKIYKNIGSSTKRESNDFIGMFGIGRFSCLSCSDTAHITSYYKGKRYSYVMYKNGGGINIDQISVVEGDFKDGLEVSIEQTIYSDEDLIKPIQKLCLFDKLHVAYRGGNLNIRHKIAEFNDREVIKFKTFSVCNSLWGYTFRNHFKVGNVLYSCDNKDSLNTKGLIIDLPMGSVDITPNREALQFTDFTNESIKKRIAEVKEELQDLVNSYLKENMDMQTFCGSFIFSSYFSIKRGCTDINIASEDITFNSKNVTVGGEKLPDNYIRFLDCIKYHSIDKTLVHKPLNTRRRYNGTVKALLLNKVIAIDKVDKVTKQVTLQYTTDTVSEPAIIFTYGGLDTFKKSLQEYADALTTPSVPNSKECVDFTFRHLPIKTMSNDSVPDSYLETYKENQRSKRKSINEKKTVIRIYHGYGYRLSSLQYLPSPGLVIYTSNTQDDAVLKNLGEFSSYSDSIAAVITVKAEYLKAFENNRRFISLENFLFLKNTILVKLATAKIILEKFQKAYSESGVALNDTPIYREFSNKYRFLLRYVVNCSNDTIANTINYYKSKGWVNQCDIEHFSLNKKEIEGYKGWKELECNRTAIIRMLAYKKYGKLPKIGLTPLIISKLQRQ